MDEMLALVATLRIDQVAALVVAEGAEALLLRNVELDILGPQFLVHPPDAGLGDVRQVAVRWRVIAEAQQRLLRLQGNHDEGSDDVREGEAVEGRVRPDADI